MVLAFYESKDDEEFFKKKGIVRSIVEIVRYARLLHFRHRGQLEERGID